MVTDFVDQLYTIHIKYDVLTWWSYYFYFYIHKDQFVSQPLYLQVIFSEGFENGHDKKPKWQANDIIT